jgi:ribosome assembly protein YihI (activator of Der GTPase)
MEPVRRLGPAEVRTPAIPAIRRLTREERERGARERERRRRDRAARSPRPHGDAPPDGGSLDVRA